MGGPSDQNQQSWGNPSSQGPPFDPSNGQVPRPPMGQPHPMQTSPNLVQLQPQSNLMNSGMVPPRSITTPQQQHHAGLQSPFTGAVNAPSPFKSNPQGIPQPNMPGNNNGGGMIGTPSFVLDKARFEMAFKTYCNKRSIKIDARLLSIENRNVDLHALHVQVMQEGGFAKV